MAKPGQKTITMSGKRLIILEKAYHKAKKKDPFLSFAAFLFNMAIVGIALDQHSKSVHTQTDLQNTLGKIYDMEFEGKSS